MRYLRFFLLLISGFLGVFGFISAIFILLIHLCSLRSFGTPFMAPFAPAIPADFKDSQIRMPVWMMSKRPKLFGAKDQVRQKANQKPGVGQNDTTPKGGKEND
jgi:spore germination protein KA